MIRSMCVGLRPRRRRRRRARVVTDTIRMLVSGLRRRARRSKVREDEERDFERAMARVLGLGVLGRGAGSGRAGG